MTDASLTKKDSIALLTMSFVIAFFLTPITINLSINGAFVKIAPFFILPLASLVYFALIKKYIRQESMIQFCKFLVIGAANTILDYGLFNAFILFLKTPSAVAIFFINAFTFSAAITHSYFWNTYWIFNEQQKTKKQFASFFLISTIGAVFLSFFVAFWAHFQIIDIRRELWLNLVKAAASLIFLFWNFFSYKFLVFKKRI